MNQFGSSSTLQVPFTTSAKLSQNTSCSTFSGISSASIVGCDQEMSLPSSRTYVSSFVSYMALAVDCQSHCDSRIDEETVFEAFERLATSISSAMQTKDSQMVVALYEFLMFTEAYGWQPLFFDVAAQLVPVLRSQGLVTVKQHYQGSGFKYLAYRDSTFVLAAE
ncbi:MAG: hypothetical protein C4288_20425 [Leptolyngbya sp. ERB_1_1]